MNVGRYVAFEGVEGAGKSTIVELFAEHLEGRGYTVVTIREPGGTPVGEGIRSLLLHGDDMAPWTEALLFAAQRAQLAAEVVGPALSRGEWVLGDRSVYSSLAYQGWARGLGVDTIRSVNAAGLGDVWPDAVVLLEVESGAGLRRQDGHDRIGGQGIDFQRRVAAGYEMLAAADPDMFVRVDASAPVQQVLTAVVEGLEKRWPF